MSAVLSLWLEVAEVVREWRRRQSRRKELKLQRHTAILILQCVSVTAEGARSEHARRLIEEIETIDAELEGL